MDILSKIQTELNAPKNQRNSFGKYNYRSCEDILEGLKPLLKEYKASVVLSDNIKMVGDRIYVEATAILRTVSDSGSVYELAKSTAFAREPLSQKGMNEAQITGSASSYARKYALNGLFAIDDNKDADTDEHQNNANNRPVLQPKKLTIKEEINNILQSGKVPAADKQAYINDFKADSNLVNQTKLDELKRKYLNARI